jgi:hypothetical protein
MKSLNDSLREEFSNILEEEELKAFIKSKMLDMNIIRGAFNKLLENKTGADSHDLIKKGRAEFETYIINTLKTNQSI